MSLKMGWEGDPAIEVARMKAVNFLEGLDPVKGRERVSAAPGTGSAALSWGRQAPTALQVVEGKVPEVCGEVGQGQEPPGQRVPEEAGTGAVLEQPVLDDLPEAGEMLLASRL